MNQANYNHKSEMQLEDYIQGYRGFVRELCARA